MFGDGSMCKCNPIAESDLATFMINCIEEDDKKNAILDLGGPDAGYTMAQQGELIFKVTPNLNLTLTYSQQGELNFKIQ